MLGFGFMDRVSYEGLILGLGLMVNLGNRNKPGVVTTNTGCVFTMAQWLVVTQWVNSSGWRVSKGYKERSPLQSHREKSKGRIPGSHGPPGISCWATISNVIQPPAYSYPPPCIWKYWTHRVDCELCEWEWFYYSRRHREYINPELKPTCLTCFSMWWMAFEGSSFTFSWTPLWNIHTQSPQIKNIVKHFLNIGLHNHLW